MHDRRVENLGKTNEKAITLIALIITVIVMLILAGIAIDLTIGENGIFKKTTEAKIINEQASILEVLRMETVEKDISIEEQNKKYIDYLKAKNVIKEVTKEDNTYYAIEVDRLIQSPQTGKGDIEKGDFYYISDGDLYYMTEQKETKFMGDIFVEQKKIALDESCFNYVINDQDEVEIIGFNFNKFDYVEKQDDWFEPNSYIAIDTISITIDGVLEIPNYIDGKKVTSLSFNKNIGISKDCYIVGVKEIIYPDTLKKLDIAGVMFPNIERINLPNGLIEIGQSAFLHNNKVQSITIPASVEKIGEMPFFNWRSDAIIIVEGKESEADFKELGANWDRNMHPNQYNEWKLTVQYLGK